MTINGFIAYVKQLWKNKPDTSTPLSADRLTHLENGIKGNSDAIEKLAAAVINQITNDPNKIASMAALYSVKQALDTTNNNLGKQISDLNNPVSDAIVPNKLYVRRYSASSAHVPSPTHGTIYHMYIDGESYATQLAVDLNRDIFARARNSGTWSDWEGYTKNADLRSIIKSNIKSIDYTWDNNSPKLIVTDANGVTFYTPLTRK